MKEYKKNTFSYLLLFSIMAFAQSPASDGQGIDPLLLQQDLESLYQQLQLNHSKLFAHRKKEDSEEHFRHISKSINKTMHRIAFYWLLAPFVSSLEDRHTSTRVVQYQRLLFFHRKGCKIE